MKEIAQQIIDDFPASYNIGRPMLGIEAATVLMECVAKTSGDYVEIGTSLGGSAVMAALAMNAAKRHGLVFCIDPFGGNSELDGFDIVYQGFWLNMGHYGIHQRIIAYKQHHPPFPPSIHYHKFSVGLIDGNHDGPAPLIDYKALNPRVKDYLLFDNTENEDVAAAVTKALKTSWKEYKSVEYESLAFEGKAVKFVALQRRQINESFNQSS